MHAKRPSRYKNKTYCKLKYSNDTKLREASAFSLWRIYRIWYITWRWFPPSVHRRALWIRLIGDSKLSPVIDWQPLQGVLCLSPNVSCDSNTHTESLCVCVCSQLHIQYNWTHWTDVFFAYLGLYAPGTSRGASYLFRLFLCVVDCRLLADQ